jgi:hypothetical protein
VILALLQVAAPGASVRRAPFENKKFYSHTMMFTLSDKREQRLGENKDKDKDTCGADAMHIAITLVLN